MIAALFVAKDGPYFNRLEVDPWDFERDAKKYKGPWPVIAHPPCERWGRYWSGGPSAKVRRKLGDDNGCFESALTSVRTWGGVIEHPAYSHAWKHFNLARPNPKGEWFSRDGEEWVCHVEQGHYGHLARKATWLYVISERRPRDLIWGESSGMRIDEGFHSNEERYAARAANRKPLKRLSKNQRIFTPGKFVSVLISLVKESC